jgi:hypothetical protein
MPGDVGISIEAMLRASQHCVGDYRWARTSASDAIINTGHYLIGLGDVVDEDVADCGRIVV